MPNWLTRAAFEALHATREAVAAIIVFVVIFIINVFWGLWQWSIENFNSHSAPTWEEGICKKIRKRGEFPLNSDPFWGVEFARAIVKNFKCGRASCKTPAGRAETGAVDWPDARDQAVDFGAWGEP